MPIRRLRSNIAAVSLIAAWILLTLGCAELKPYRTSASTSGLCTPNYLGQLPKSGEGTSGEDACKERLTEESKDYQLLFFEYDDQGYPFAKTSVQSQINLDELYKKISLSQSGERYSIVTFIHGWKHTAEAEDTNVQAFRSFLTQLAEYEGEMGCHRKVIGIYVGWRGAGSKFVHMSTIGDYMEDVTFWSRKEAARRVSVGGIHSLLATVERMEDKRNTNWLVSGESQKADPCYTAKPVRNIVVGHSFGGLIAYSALEDTLIRKVMHLHDKITETASDRANPELRAVKGDLVLLINPAIEATRFYPLFSTTRDPYNRFSTYQTPMFVAVTSTDDGATRVAFPAGRLINEATKQYLDGESEADRTTFGHYTPYITHVLLAGDEYAARPSSKPIVAADGIESSKACAAWTAELRLNRGKGQYVSTQQELASLLAWQKKESGEFVDANSVSAPFPREFCSDTRYYNTYLKEETDHSPGLYLFPAPNRDPAVDLNSPVWNVRTSHPILDDHGDISNQRLWVFLRQLYEEGAVNLVQ